MYMGQSFANYQMYDITGNRQEIIAVDENGNANF